MIEKCNRPAAILDKMPAHAQNMRSSESRPNLFEVCRVATRVNEVKLEIRNWLVNAYLLSDLCNQQYSG